MTAQTESLSAEQRTVAIAEAEFVPAQYLEFATHLCYSLVL